MFMKPAVPSLAWVDIEYVNAGCAARGDAELAGWSNSAIGPLSLLGPQWHQGNRAPANGSLLRQGKIGSGRPSSVIARIDTSFVSSDRSECQRRLRSSTSAIRSDQFFQTPRSI